MTSKYTYTHGHQDSVLRSHRWRTAENSAAYLLPHLSPGMSVLDVGCGPGTVTVDLAARVAPGKVVGIDLSDTVIEEARSYAAERGVANVSFLAGDVHDADLPAASFDVVHAHQVLQHLPDPVATLGRMKQLVKPGGIVAVRDSDYAAKAWAPIDDRLTTWLSVYREVARRNGAEPDAGRWLLSWAQQAGLRDIAYSSSTWTYATPELRKWWGGLWAERVLTSSFAEQAVAYGIATRADLADMAEGWQAWAASPDGVYVVVLGEVIGRR